MGREIRHVPKGWEHPQVENISSWDLERHNHYYKPGDFCYNKIFRPMYDESLGDAEREWFDELAQWKQGKHEWQLKYPDDNPPTYAAYVDYAGRSPDPGRYRPTWKPEEMTCYQIYETVSEGTPTSPVFETLDEMKEWLIGQGYSEKAAEGFIKMGSVPSGFFSPQTGYVENIEIAGLK